MTSLQYDVTTEQRIGWTQELAPLEQGKQNVGQMERIVTGAAGAILAVFGLARRSVPGVLIAGIGGALLYRGASGRCPIYSALDIDMAHPDAAQDVEAHLDEHGIHVEQAFQIDRPAAELYAFWRNFENLPRIMTHLKSVKVIDDRRSHWEASAPAIAGGSVTWEAEITHDQTGEIIGWQSLPGSQVECRGAIRFSKALGDRGTEVHVFMDYLPPAGKAGHWLATLFGKAPRRQMREDLRNFKRIMELGELPKVEGQPRGTCMGQGKYQAS